ncbi:MAG: hypothetical protein DMF76_02290 [Acidobacteria bacterium]|nr:MAG: hypothetical protein DMF76_02290 [Acidobacteriota bacterium]
MPNEIHSYTDLQQQIHEDLRIQHPDWVKPNGDCPTCDSYESRLAELLGLSQRSNAARTHNSFYTGYTGYTGDARDY